MSYFDFNDKGTLVEQSVLSVLLCNEDILRESDLDVDLFANPLHQRIYQSIKTIYQEKGVIDFVELVNQNKDVYGLIEYVIKLQDIYITSNDFYVHVNDLQELYKNRKAHDILKKCDEGELTYDEMLGELTKTGLSFSNDSSATMISPKDMFELITTDTAKLKFEDFHSLQSKIGFIENTLNIIAARTSVGKSAFALNLINDLSRHYKCLYMNMEMTEKEFYQRLVGINSAVPINDFISVKDDTKKYNQLSQGINQVHNKKIKLYNGSKSIDGIRKIISRESRNEHCIVFIDYIGYVSTRKKQQNDRERVGEATRELQVMSKDFNCTLFVLAQINREGNDVPTLTNLKDSGELEQSGHAVLILHNPSKDINDQYPTYELYVAKNRSGKLGKINIKFNKPTQRFEVI